MLLVILVAVAGCGSDGTPPVERDEPYAPAARPTSSAFQLCRVGPVGSDLTVEFFARDAERACDELVRDAGQQSAYWKRTTEHGDTPVVCHLQAPKGGEVTVRGSEYGGQYQGREICARIIGNGATDLG